MRLDVVHDLYLSTWELEQEICKSKAIVVHSEFEACLAYVRPCLKKKGSWGGGGLYLPLVLALRKQEDEFLSSRPA